MSHYMRMTFDINAKIKMSNKILLIFFMCVIDVIFCGIQCKDENNNDVDWFVMYKLPKNAENANNFVKEGLAYTFITSKNISNQWHLSNMSINDTNSILGHTFNPLYNDKDVTHYLYNDQPPEGKASDENGHSKGVLVINNNNGFWLIHSVPHFPPKPESSYSYPKTGTHFGQSILCVSLTSANIEAVASQLMYIRPYAYSNFINDKPAFPNLSKLINGEYIRVAPFWREKHIQSLDGMVFRSFAKTSKFCKDLYVDWLAQALQENLLVETWPNGPGRLRSNCSLPYRVNNVEKIQIPVSNLVFNDHVDHSKWTVASGKPWICIGGINRAEHQMFRGGGTLCFQSTQIWETYKKSIIEIEPCTECDL